MIETASFKYGRFDEVGLTYGIQIFCTGINLVFFQGVEKLPDLTERFDVATFLVATNCHYIQTNFYTKFSNQRKVLDDI